MGFPYELFEDCYKHSKYKGVTAMTIYEKSEIADNHIDESSDSLPLVERPAPRSGVLLTEAGKARVQQ